MNDAHRDLSAPVEYGDDRLFNLELEKTYGGFKMSLSGFAVKRNYESISIINHDLSGSTFEMRYHPDDIPELIGLLQIAYEAWLREVDADMAAEAEQLAEAEGGGVSQRETELEMRYSDQGHDAY